MSRNRKNHANIIRFGPALKALGLCLFLGGSGVGYVWQKEQILRLNDDFHRSEIRYEQLRRRNDDLSRTLDALQSTRELELRIKKFDLGLVAPQPDQIVHIREVPILPGVVTNLGEQLFAGRLGRILTPRNP